jgi:hypothetical protein
MRCTASEHPGSNPGGLLIVSESILTISILISYEPGGRLGRNSKMFQQVQIRPDDRKASEWAAGTAGIGQAGWLHIPERMT